MDRVHELIEKLRARAKAIEANPPRTAVDSKSRGALVHHLNQWLGGDQARHRFLAMVFGLAGQNTKSVNDLTPHQLLALIEWVDSRQEEGEWIASSQFVSDCIEIRRVMGAQKGLIPGVSIIDTHCSEHGEIGETTPHLYRGYDLVCLLCHPELDYRKEKDDVG